MTPRVEQLAVELGMDADRIAEYIEKGWLR